MGGGFGNDSVVTTDYGATMAKCMGANYSYFKSNLD